MIKSKNTRPENVVKKVCRDLGHKGYRIHRKDLPGSPDIAFVGRKLAIFVNGCFWHGHKCTGKVRLPKSKKEYWHPKIERNMKRDIENINRLKSTGWNVITIWECETKHIDIVKEKISNFLSETDPI